MDPGAGAHGTPRRVEPRDHYQRPGHHGSSAERDEPRKNPFFTNLTSVNIATAFARAHITSDTIRRRPAHLKGAPMSPSQIPTLSLGDARFEPAPAAAAARRDHHHLGAPDAEGRVPDGFLRERNWDLGQAAAPSWLRRIQDQRSQGRTNIMHESPPAGLLDSPSNALGRSALPAPQFAPLADGGTYAKRSAYAPADGGLYAKRSAYTPATREPGAAAAAAAAAAAIDRPANGSRLRGAAPAASTEYIGDGTAAPMPGLRAQRPRSRAAASATAAALYGGYQDDDDDAGYAAPATYAKDAAKYKDPAGYAEPAYANGTPYHSGGADENANGDDDNGRGRKTPRPQSRYSLRSHVSSPNRLSYDRDFNPYEEGHDNYLRGDADSAGRRSAAGPTPYTARIKGPGAFPGTAQRFSRRNPGPRDADDAVSPTEARLAGARTASGNAALADADLLANHRYLSHGAAHRGWGEYAQVEDAASVHSFSDSFASNSTNGGGGGGARARDNPTLMRRLLRNIAVGWSGSTGSFAERVSFVFFMAYFLVKETCVVLGTFLLRLVLRLVLRPLCSGVREVILLPNSLWRVLEPGSSHDTAGLIKGILTALLMIAAAIVVAQYGHPTLGGLAALPLSILGGGGGSSNGGWSARPRPRTPTEPLAGLAPLTDDEVERLGGHGSVVVDRLITVEQTLKQLYGLLDALQSHRDDDTQDLREALKKLQQERQALLDAKRGEQQRIDNLEREYSSMKRDLKASSASSAESAKLARELQSIKQHVDKLAKGGGGWRGKGAAAGPSLDEVRRLVGDAIKAQERELQAMLKPQWLATDGDAAYAHVARMIEDALTSYTNDRLGKTDFALLSAGARIIPGLTSPTFEPPARGLAQRLWRRMGMVSSHPPATILDPAVHVGECWPMRGAAGQVAVHLAQPVDVTEFAVEHVAKSIAIDWRSAPRQIEIWGYVLGESSADDGAGPATGSKEPDAAGGEPDAVGGGPGGADEPDKPDTASKPDAQPVVGHGIANPPFAESGTRHGLGRLALLAAHEYVPSDTAAVQIVRPAGGPLRVRTLIVKVNSNWGHPNHTCIYRFRVHGRLAAAP
ncbi:hypothetical protein H4R18_002488 [Coemansia javaensis]|uniref:SUN domain-containing protein n=1 Tax=Coemansia javaensis TaxID=2761396 RepID=A0A9W8LIN2_9FUNG|nr:hypothetical protein H4R18_002488 [Coemansia javaensis]